MKRNFNQAFPAKKQRSNKRTSNVPRLMKRSSLGRRRALNAKYSSSNAEVKTVDIPIQGSGSIVQAVISTTGTVTTLNGTEEGAGMWNRVGRKIMLKNLRIRGLLTQSGTVTGVGEYLRAMVIYDRQPNGSTPALTDILLGYGYDGTPSSTVSSFNNINMNNSERFRILRDYHWSIPNNSQSTTATAPIGAMSIIDYNNDRTQIDDFIKLGGLEAQYKSSTGSVADITTGHLFVLTVGNLPAANAGYTLTFSARLRFTDFH